MMSHKNAKSTALGRMTMVQMVIGKGRSVADAAEAFGVSTWTVRKWLRRYLSEGKMGLYDRSSEPNWIPHGMPSTIAERIVELRRQRWTYARIANEVGRSHSAVGRVCKSHGVNRLDRLDPKEPVIRYERSQPGELLHFDTKKLGRIDYVGHRITGDRRAQKQQQSKRGRIGYEVAHVCIDDATRIAYVEVLPDERRDTTTAFAQRAVAWFTERGVNVERLMSDNGSAYRSRTFRKFCELQNIRHLFTRPYRPETNGKAERFIKTALKEWAYERPYPTSDARADRLPQWLDLYNYHRPHHALRGAVPMSRLASNLVGVHT